MLTRLTQYLTALIALSASSVIYQNLISPWMEPPQVESVVLADRKPGSDTPLTGMFPPGAWQLGTCKQVMTRSGMLVFQKFEQTSADSWRLEPITVIVGRGMSGAKDGEPVIIEADGGAEIRFTEKFDIFNSTTTPSIRRGAISGNVHIHRRSNEADRSIDIRTSNVGIDNHQIWTTESINMRVGNAQLLGRDLTMHLAGPTASATGGATALLDKMTLVYLDHLTMPLETGSLFEVHTSASDTARVPAPTTQPRTKALVSLRCDGLVEYDFNIDLLSMRTNVVLEHQSQDGLRDRFSCESLDLTLNDPTNRSIARQNPLDWLVSIVASGTSEIPAVADLKSIDAGLMAERIDFHALKGLVTASGRKGVQVRRGAIVGRLANLIYQFDAKHPKVIGAIDVDGPGIVTFDDPTIPLRRAQWKDRLEVRPTGNARNQQNADISLGIDGQFHAWLTDGGEFKADTIDGKLKRDDDAAVKGRTAFVPDVFSIKGNVSIDTTAIEAHTDNLRLYFVSDPNSVESAPNESATTSTTLRQLVTQPGKGQAIYAPVARPRPTIRGQTINALLRRNDAGLSAKELAVVGSVKVSHQLTSGGQTLPMQLTAERLQLVNEAGEDVLHLTSAPGSMARFELGDGFFVGSQIQVRTADNIVWIENAGEFQLPTAALPRGLGGDGTESIEWTQPPRCRWQGEMIFDGRTAVLSDGVEITASFLQNGQPVELHMQGDRLELELMSDVQVRDMSTMRNATVKRISLFRSHNHPVVVDGLRRAADGVLESKHRIHASKLTFTPSAGGGVVAEGPGWYRSWLAPQSNSAMLSGGAAGSIANHDGQLTGVHLVFNESMQGDLAAQRLDFLGGVRVGSRAVQSWDEVFDAQAMDALAIGDSTLDCDQLRISIEPGTAVTRVDTRLTASSAAWEMEAIGSVIFRTRDERGWYEGTASRAAYASAKDLFTIDGSPQRAAFFRRTMPDGSKGLQARMRTIAIQPRTMEIMNSELEGLSFPTPSISGSRSPQRQ